MSLRLTETLRLLSEARRIVTDGERCMSEQREIVDGLEGEGFDALDGILHLEILEGMQEEYTKYLERLEQKVLLLVRPED
jgi:hypothetical protein